MEQVEHVVDARITCGLRWSRPSIATKNLCRQFGPHIVQTSPVNFLTDKQSCDDLCPALVIIAWIHVLILKLEAWSAATSLAWSGHLASQFISNSFGQIIPHFLPASCTIWSVRSTESIFQFLLGALGLIAEFPGKLHVAGQACSGSKRQEFDEVSRIGTTAIRFLDTLCHVGSERTVPVIRFVQCRFRGRPQVARVHEIVSAIEPWDDQEAG
jgi:hypothetical protein